MRRKEDDKDGGIATPVSLRIRPARYNSSSPRAALAKEEVRGKADIYLTLVRRYAALQPGFAPAVLAEAVRELNREWRGGAAATDPVGEAPDSQLRPISLPASLLEVDDAGVQQSLASVEAPPKRIRLRLGLLAASLDKLRERARAKQAAPAATN